MTPYETLGLAPDATPEQIKKAHRRRASETHPDMGGDREEFQRVQAAYELLSDPDRRARFDATGDDGRDDVPPAEVIAKRAFTDSLTDEHRCPSCAPGSRGSMRPSRFSNATASPCPPRWRGAGK